MTIEQLNSLNEDEVSMLWYIVNKLPPPILSEIELEPELFTSIKHDGLINKIINAHSFIKPEANSIYDALKNKMGIIQ